MAKRSAAKRKDAAPAETTKSSQEALSVRANTEARADVKGSNRWATIKEIDEAFDPKDPRVEVINISLMEGGTPPEPGELADESNENAGKYSYQRVAGGVIIGMRRGGPFESVDGFGWRDAEDKAAHGNPVGGGATRLADTRR